MVSMLVGGYLCLIIKEQQEIMNTEVYLQVFLILHRLDSFKLPDKKDTVLPHFLVPRFLIQIQPRGTDLGTLVVLFQE